MAINHHVEPNLGPLEKQLVLLSAESFPKSLDWAL